MGNEYSTTKFETKRKSSDNTNLSKSLSKRNTNNTIDFFARNLKSELKNYYPFNFNIKSPKTDKKLKRSHIGDLINSDKSFSLSINYSLNLLKELSLTNNLDMITSTFLDNQLVMNNLSVINYIDNKTLTLQEIINSDFPNFNSSSSRTITTVNKELDELESNIDEYYKELQSQKEILSSQGNNSINSNKIFIVNGVLNRNKNIKIVNTKSPDRSPPTTNRKDKSKSPDNHNKIINKISKSPDINNKLNNTKPIKSDIISVNSNKKANPKGKIIKLELKLADYKKEKNISPKHDTLLQKTMRKYSTNEGENNKTTKSKSKSPLRRNEADKSINYSSLPPKTLEQTSNKFFSKSPTNNGKVKTIIYKPELNITKTSQISSLDDLNKMKDEKIQNRSINKSNISEHTSYPGVIKINYTDLMKKKIEDEIRLHSPQHQVKSTVFNKSVELDNNVSIHKKKKNDDTAYKNINININELNIIKKDNDKIKSRTPESINKDTKYNSLEQKIKDSYNSSENNQSTKKSQFNNEETNDNTLSKLNYLKNLKVNFNINQVQTFSEDGNKNDIEEIKSPSFSVNSDTNSDHKNINSKKNICSENVSLDKEERSDTPIFNHIHKRSNSFGGPPLDTKMNMNDFNPSFEELEEGQGDKFSFRNILNVKQDQQTYLSNKYTKPIIMKSNTHEINRLEESGGNKKSIINNRWISKK